MNSRSTRYTRKNESIKLLPRPNRSQQIDSLLEDGLRYFRQGNLQAVVPLFQKVLQIEPSNFDALHLLGVVAYQNQEFTSAANFIAQALVVDPLNANALNNLASALIELKRFDEAIEKLNLAVSIKSDYAEALFNIGNCFFKTDKFEMALEKYRNAIRLKPNYVSALNNMGSVLIELGQFENAIHCFEQAIKSDPSFSDAFFNYGNALRKLKCYSESIEKYLKALDINPTHVMAYCNLGASFADLGRINEAEKSYLKAVDIQPKYAEAHYNLANVLKKQMRYEEALKSYDAALSLNPHLVEAYTNQGSLFAELKYLDLAVDRYSKALSIKPDSDFVLGQMLHLKMKQCDWSNFTEFTAAYIEGLLEQKKIMPPFAALGLIDHPALHLLCSKIYNKTKCPKSETRFKFTSLEKSEKIRIGYFSADFHSHATTHLMAQLFELHDREKFEVFGFSFGPNIQDYMRLRVSAAFFKFFEVSAASDLTIASLARDCGIDIAVDLKGYTQDSRPGIFAEGAAPIQISYLGYPSTMGAEYIDYIIADSTVIPPEQQAYYSEKVIYLPECYQVNDSKRQISTKKFTKSELGLPNNGFVYCSFNNNYKITPDMFDCWMRILLAVDNSVLWLLEDNEFASHNLRAEAVLRGVNSERLIFANRLPANEHLARHSCANLFLDTYPYNAHTTASDSLWADLPVLTLAGEAFASRVAASLLSSLKLPELITYSIAEYEERAIELANDVLGLQKLKQQLKANKLGAPLFNTQFFTHKLEDAYSQVYHQFLDGKSPEHIYVK